MDLFDLLCITHLIQINIVLKYKASLQCSYFVPVSPLKVRDIVLYWGPI